MTFDLIRYMATLHYNWLVIVCKSHNQNHAQTAEIDGSELKSALVQDINYITCQETVDIWIPTMKK